MIFLRLLLFWLLLNTLVLVGAVVMTYFYEWSLPTIIIMILSLIVTIGCGSLVHILNQPLKLSPVYTGFAAFIAWLCLFFGAIFPGESWFYLQNSGEKTITPEQTSMLTGERIVRLSEAKFLYEQMGKATMSTKLGDSHTTWSVYALPVVSTKWQVGDPVAIFVTLDRFQSDISHVEVFKITQNSSLFKDAIHNAEKSHGIKTASDVIVLEITNKENAGEIIQQTHRYTMVFLLLINSLLLILTLVMRKDLTAEEASV